MAIEPIRPDEVSDEKFKTFPDEVISAWNEMIVQKWNPALGVAHIKQEEIVELLALRVPNTNRGVVFEKHYLDIEELYRAQGWKVLYDKPHYTENYKAYFEFRK